MKKLKYDENKRQFCLETMFLTRSMETRIRAYIWYFGDRLPYIDEVIRPEYISDVTRNKYFQAMERAREENWLAGSEADHWYAFQEADKEHGVNNKRENRAREKAEAKAKQG